MLAFLVKIRTDSWFNSLNRHSLEHNSSTVIMLCYLIEGLPKDFVSILLSAAGVAEIPMRIFNGWFADKKFVLVSTQVALCMLFTGVAAFICAAISGTAGK